jgi:hypothetical protein
VNNEQRHGTPGAMTKTEIRMTKQFRMTNDEGGQPKSPDFGPNSARKPDL